VLGDSLKPRLPFEFVIFGTAVSAQGSAASIAAWKKRVTDAARAALPEGSWLLSDPLAVTIYIFPKGLMQGDLDNRLKPLLDAMVRCVYDDDRLVERIVAQKFEPGRQFAFADPGEALLGALASEDPNVDIRLSDDFGEDRSDG
jgi:hypothetical protein